MDIIKAPKTIKDPVYRTELKHSPATAGIVIKGNDKSVDSDAELNARLTGNIMEVGAPEYWNLKQLCANKNIGVTDEQDMALSQSDFWLIQSAFAFIPAPGSKFKWARIVAQLEGLNDDTANPIAYDLFPKNISQEKNKEKEINIGLNFKFKTIVGTKAEYIQKIELATLEPLISVAGIGKSKPTWDFRNKAAFCLRDVNALYMILKVPIRSKGLKIKFFGHAEIETKWGGIFPTTAKPKSEESYELRFHREL